MSYTLKLAIKTVDMRGFLYCEDHGAGQLVALAEATERLLEVVKAEAMTTSLEVAVAEEFDTAGMATA